MTAPGPSKPPQSPPPRTRSPRSFSPTSSDPTSPTRRESLNNANPHAPTTPSRLWQSHALSSSPESTFHDPPRPISASETWDSTSPRSGSPPVGFEEDGTHPAAQRGSAAAENVAATHVTGTLDEPEGNIHTTLLENYNRCKPRCGHENCGHGIFSPHGPRSASIRSRESRIGFRGRYDGGQEEGGSWMQGVFGYNVADGVLRNGHRRQDSKMSITKRLANEHGIKGKRRMYITYYFPFSNWITQYKLAWLKGDLIAALTMASFYIPMSLSYATNLGHVPAINGLYTFVFNPLIYAFLGTCPQMVVGPEAAGSLLVGSVVRTSVDKGDSGDEDQVMNARIAGVVTGMAGVVILIAGLTRLGFLDSVLSRPFLRGFISAIGFVILVDQTIPEMGLVKAAKAAKVDHGSSMEKLIFLIRNAGNAHALTCWISFGSLGIILFFRFMKQRLQPKYPSVAYIPDRFLVVVLSAILTYALRWDERGLDILGEVKSGTGSAFPFRWPFVPTHMKHIREAMSTSFLIALLGFFESSVAAKALGGGEGKAGESIQGVSLSANRELVALGVANMIGGCFMALPGFGGYGRSKVNASTGGRTPMSSIILSLITVLSILFLLPYFYYLPKGVLSAMVSVVAYSLIEECPHDIKFFIQVRGWSELALMFLIFGATIFYSLPLGMALGMGLSLLSVIKHATKPRIQILGKVPGTTNQFESAEDNPHKLEFIEGCLIVKIPEPLTFANTGDLKARLRRLEMYGTTAVHPALPRVRPPENNRNVIFDVHGVTSLDASGTQVLTEIVDGWLKKGARVFFCRIPSERSKVFQMFVRSGIVERCGGMEHFVRSVDEALRLAEEARDEQYRDEV